MSQLIASPLDRVLSYRLSETISLLARWTCENGNLIKQRPGRAFATRNDFGGFALCIALNLACTMSVPAPWLATFVEQCLDFFLGNTAHNGIEVEDDGATLSFRKPKLTSVAAISEVCPLFFVFEISEG